MTRALNKIFSMPLMAVALLIFFSAIGAATFIENDFGTPVAQKWVYKAKWFEAVIAYLFLTLGYNLFRYKLFQIKKIGSLIFHVSLMVIVIGAWVTRMFGFEGAMSIREGGSSNVIVSYDTYIQIKAHDFNQQYVYDLPVIMDGYTDNHFTHSFEFPGETEPVNIEFVSLMEHVKDTLVPQGKSKGEPYIEVVTVGGNGRQTNYIKSGDVIPYEGIKIAFNTTEHTDAISVFETDSGTFVSTPYELKAMQMGQFSAQERDAGTISAEDLEAASNLIVRDSLQPFPTGQLYSTMGLQFMFKAYYPSASLEMVESKAVSKDVKAVTVNVSQGANQQEVVLRGGKGILSAKTLFSMGNLNYELGYGSKEIKLPFYLFLDDFELERYPGTNNPSSYSSRVTLIDPTINLEQEHHIYMNNVLDYQGYRFFQSSYDPDEFGTVLSVNHDAPGTLITYLGYLLLGLGFVINLIQPGGRFRYLMRKSHEAREKRKQIRTLVTLIGFLLFSSTAAFAQDTGTARDNPIFESNGENLPIDYDHAERFGHLIIQDQRGRFQPVHTLASNVLKKVSRQSTYNGLSPMQVFLGIHTNAVEWNLEPFIYVSGSELREKLNLTSSRASLVDFFTLDFQYILEEDAATARRKKPAEQSQYDKDVLKTDERLNIVYGVFTGLYLKIMPLPNDPGENWYSPFDQNHPFEGEDAEFMNSIIPLYNMAVQSAHETKNWEQADQVIDLIDVFQRRVANAETIPSKDKVEWEIFYNKADVFKKLSYSYLIVGLILLILNFIQIFAPRFNLKWPLRIGFILFVLMFVAHGVGLGMRWYLSGHAPWSNGYEAVVFIAFVTVLAGLLFYKQSPIVLGATGKLAWLMLFVAHMNALDPEITNLVPVLKSYWLMIHVAIITGSYGFLGLGAILGLLCLVMNLFLTQNNKKRVKLTTKELTHVSEATIMIGLFMLTIGTFLGGVWANESWGRYWGWDAKETWALASVIMYAIILHFRFIPGLKKQFVFNLSSLWGYSSIIMTFFGVNFYLSGLHSYAQGDPVPIPSWVYVTTAILLVLTVFSGINLYRFRSSGSKPAGKEMEVS